MASSTGFVKEGQEKLSDVDATARAAMDKKADGGDKSQWQNIQKKSFINWFNVHLRQNYTKTGKAGGKLVSDFQELDDGLLLIVMLEQLSKKKFPRHNKNPRIKPQRLENLLQTLKFIDTEGMTLVNIGAEDLQGGSEKLWMGLIWTLIGKYAIRIANKRMSPRQAMQNWLTTVMPDYRVGNFSTAWNSGIALCALVEAIQPGLCPDYQSLDPKNGVANCELGMQLAEKHLGIQRVFDAADLNNSHIDERSVMTYLSLFTSKTDDNLLEWVRGKLPDFELTGFGKDWNSGMALAALVDALQPGLFPQCRKLSPKNAKANIAKALKLAKDKLGVDDVLTAEEIADPKLDDLLMATYIQGFQRCTTFQPPTASGPGLVRGDVGVTATFSVDATKAAEADLAVTVVAPHSQLEATVARDKNPLLYSVSYTPSEPGVHTVKVLHGDTHVSESPYRVPVVDLSQCVVSGKVLESGATLAKPYLIMVDASRAGPGELKVTLVDPGKQPCPFELMPGAAGFYKVQSVPPKPGIYELTVEYAGKPVPESPFLIHVSDPNACQLLTRVNKGYVHPVRTPFDALLNTKQAGDNARLSVTVTCGETTEQLACTQPSRDGTVTATLVPTAAGYHAISTKLNDCHIAGSPLSLPVVDPGLCTLHGLRRRIPVHRAFNFSMRTNQPVGAELEVKISGNNNCNAPVVTRSSAAAGGGGGSGDSFDIALHPTAVGTITATLHWAGDSVPASPVSFEVVDAARCSLVSLSERVRVGEAVTVVASAQDAGGCSGDMSVRAVGATVTYPCSVRADGGDRYSAAFTTKESGPHQVHVEWCDAPITGSPFPVEVLPTITTAEITAKGPGLAEAFTQVPTEFDIIAPDKGLMKEEKLQCSIRDPSGRTLDAVVADKDDGRYTVSYTSLTPGSLTVAIKYAGADIPLSPFTVQVLERPCADRCEVTGKCTEPSAVLPRSKPADMIVAAAKAGHGALGVVVVKPDGRNGLVLTARQGTDTTVRFDCDLVGRYRVDVKWANEHVPRSPFYFDVIDRLEAAQVEAAGSGLVTGWTKQVAEFSIKADDGPSPIEVDCLHITATPPSQLHQPQQAAAKPGRKASKSAAKAAALPVSLEAAGASDGSAVQCRAAYTPTECGDHRISVLYRDQHVPGSPFRATIREAANADECKVSADWAATLTAKKSTPCHLLSGDRFKLRVDAANAGEGDLSATATHVETGAEAAVPVVLLGNKEFGVVSEPVQQAGESRVAVKWSGEHVPASPFTVLVAERFTAGQMTATGDGLVGGWTQTPSQFLVHGRLKGLLKSKKLTVAIMHVGKDRQPAATGGERPAKVVDKADGTYDVQYTSVEAGLHEVAVLYEEQHIQGSPFQAMHKVSPDASQCTASAPWLKNDPRVPASIPQGEHVQLSMDASKAGDGSLLATATCNDEPIDVLVEAMKNSQSRVHLPDVSKLGRYSVEVQWSGRPIAKSPFLFNIVECLSASDIAASGEGLVEGWSHKLSQFMIHAKRKTGLYQQKLLQISILPVARGTATQKNKGAAAKPSTSTPEAVQSTVDDNNDGSYKVKYTAMKSGDHHISILYQDQHIPGSPFRASIKASPDASRCVLSAGWLDASDGPAQVQSRPAKDASKGKVPGKVMGRLTQNAAKETSPSKAASPTMTSSLLTGDAVEASVDTRDAGQGTLTAELRHVDSDTILDTSVTTRQDGGHVVRLERAEKCGKYRLSLWWSGDVVPGCPLEFTVAERLTASQITATGEGLYNAWTKKSSSFNVNALQTKLVSAGRLKIRVSPGSSSADALPSDVTDNGEGTYSVKYEPTVAGDHTISIQYDDQHIPASPFKLAVKESPDASKCTARVPWLKNDPAIPANITQGDTVQLIVDASKAGEGVLSAAATCNDEPIDVLVDVMKGNRSRVYIPDVDQLGRYKVEVQWSGQPIAKSPFLFNTTERLTAHSIVASGDGLVEGWSHKPSQFLLHAKETTGLYHQKLLQINIQPASTDTGTRTDSTSVAKPSTSTPEAVQPTVDDKNDGSYKVKYTAVKSGDHHISILYQDQHIPGSPFRASIKASPDASRCVLSAGWLDATDGPAQAQSRPAKDASKGKAPGKLLSRFTQNAANQKSPSKAASPTMTSSLLTGDAVEASVDTRDAGQGTLTAELRHVDSDTILDTSVTARQDGSHVVRLERAEKCGKYRLSLWWSGDVVPGCPQEFTVAERLTAKEISATGEGLYNAWTKKSSTFNVNALQTKLVSAGRLKIRVSPSSSSADALPSDVTDNGEGTYSVKYEPTVAGNHTISIQYDDQHIPASPFKLAVKESPDAALCTAAAPWLPSGRGVAGGKAVQPCVCGDGLELNVDTSNAGVGELTSTARHIEDDEAVDVVVEHRKNKPSRICVPRVVKAGRYHINVSWDGKAIAGSPFSFTAVERFTAADVTASGDGLAGGWSHKPSQFVLDAKKRTNLYDQKQLKITIQHAGSHTASAAAKTSISTPEAVQPTVDDNNDGSYKVKYTAVKSGDHHISILYQDQHIPGSPFRASIKASPDASQCVLSAGWLDATDGRAQVQSRPAKDASNGKVPGKVMGRLTQNAAKETSPSKAASPTMTSSLLTGDAVEASVDTRDAGQGTLTAELRHVDSDTILDTSVTARQDGGHVVRLERAEKCGKYRLSLWWSGDVVPGCPLEFIVAERLMASQIMATGEGLYNAWTKKSSSFNVNALQTKLVSAGRLKIRVSPSSSSADALPSDVTDNGEGTYSVKYEPTVAGDHTISIQYDDQHIPASPFKLAVKESPDASKCTTRVPWLKNDPAIPANITQGDTVQLIVDASKAGEGVLSAAATCNDEPIDVLVDVMKGNRSRVYIPDVDQLGRYKVEVQWSGQPIAKSPFLFNTTERLTAHSIVASGDGLVEGWSHKPSQFLLHAKETTGLYHQKLLQINIQPASTDTGTRTDSTSVAKPSTSTPEAVQPTVDDKNDGSYKVKYTAVKSGDHHISILYQDQHIPGSPFRASIKASPDASRCVLSAGWLDATDGPDQVQSRPAKDASKGKAPGKLLSRFTQNAANQKSPAKVASPTMTSSLLTGDAVEASVDTRDAGQGTLTAELRHVDSDTILDTSVTTRQDGGHVVRLERAEKCGKYRLSLWWSGDVVPDCPQEFTVAERLTAKEISATGEGLYNAWTKKSSTFNVNALQTKLVSAGRLKIRVSPSSSSADALPSDVTDNGEGTYSVKYEPTVAGDHTISIQYDDQHIPASPFKLAVKESPDAALCTAAAPWLPSGRGVAGGKAVQPCVCGDGLELNVDTSNAGVGELTSTARHVEDDEAVDVVVEHRKNEPSRICLPQVVKAGRYHMNVFWDGKAIAGSPFSFTAVERFTAADVTASGDGLAGGWSHKPSQFVLDAKKRTNLYDQKQLKITIQHAGSHTASAAAKTSISTPEAVQPTVDDKNDGSYKVKYTAVKSGDHHISILYQDQHIPGSPFRASIKASPDASCCVIIAGGLGNVSKTKSNGPVGKAGKAEKQCVCGEGFELGVETSNAGVGELTATSHRDEDDEAVDVVVEHRKNKPSRICVPRVVKAGRYHVNVFWDGKAIAGSPFSFTAVPKFTAADIEASGEGLLNGWTNTPAKFSVKCAKANLYHSKQLKIRAYPAGSGERGQAKDARVRVHDNDDGNYQIEYEPSQAGEHVVNVQYQDQHIPGSPFRADIKASPDASRCVIIAGELGNVSKTKSNGPVGKAGKAEKQCVCGEGFELGVETSNAGVGELTATSRHVEDDEAVDVVVEHRKNKPSRIYVPRVVKAGRYHVNVSWDGKAIAGSPFSFTAVERFTAADVTASGDGVSTGWTKKPAKFSLKCAKANLYRLKLLKVTARPAVERSVEARVSVHDNDDGSYRVEYEPSQAGDHIVSVQYQDQHIPGSPFNAAIQLSPVATRCKVSADWLAKKKAAVGDPLIVSVSAALAGVGDLSTELVDPSLNVVDTNVLLKKQAGEFDILMKCSTLGQHQLTVKWSGINVPGSPFKFTSTLPTSPHHVQVSGKGLHQAVCGSNASFSICPASGLPGLDAKALSLTLESEHGYSLPIKVQNKASAYTASYKAPPQPGSYLLSVQYHHQHVPFSPFQVEVVEAQPESVIPIDGPTFQLSHTVGSLAQGEALKFCLASVDPHSPPPQVTATDPDGVTVPVRVAKQNDGSGGTVVAAQLQAAKAGPYRIQVQTNGELAATPVVIDVKERAHSPADFSVSGDGLRTATVGVPEKVVLRGPEAGLLTDGRLKVDVTPARGSASTMSSTTRVEDNHDGSYGVVYTARSSGQHAISVRYNGKHVPGSPFTVTCKRAADPAACRLLGNDGAGAGNVKLNGGDNITFVLDTSSAGDGELVVEATGPDGQGAPAFVHSGTGSGGRSTVLVPTAQLGTGSYRVVCTWHGECIPGFPKTYDVVENVSLKTVKVTGRGLSETAALKESSFTIQAWDVGLFSRGVLKVHIDGEQGRLNRTVTELQGRGTYLVSYIAPVPGDYQIHVLSQGKHVLGSPFALTVTMPPQPQLCTAVGRCLDSTGYPVQPSAAEFTVDTSEGGGGDLVVRCLAPDGTAVATYQSMESRGVHTIKMSPVVSGRHTVDVLWSGDHIPGSPFSMDVEMAKGAAAAAGLTVSGSALSKAYASTPAAFTIEAPGGLLPEDVTVSVSGAKGQQAEVNVRQASSDALSAIYVPPTIGAYLVNVLHQGAHVHGSPFKVSVFQRPRPDRCAISGAHVEGKKYCQAGKQLPFSVATRNAGHGRLTVAAVSPRGNAVAAYVATNADDRTVHMVKVDTAEAGKYLINVKWNDVHVPRSPLKVRVYPAPDASKVRVGGPGISAMLPVKDTTYISVDASDAGFGQLTVHLRGPSASLIQSRVEKNPDNPRQVKAWYTPTQAGDYIVRIQWSGVSVPGSPFTVNAVDPRTKRPKSPPTKSPASPRWKFKRTISQVSDRLFSSVEPDMPPRPPHGHAVGPGGQRQQQQRRDRAWSDEDIESAQLALWGDSAAFGSPSPPKSHTVSSVTDRKLRQSISSQQKTGVMSSFFTRKSKNKGFSRRTSSPAVLQPYEGFQPASFGGKFALTGRDSGQLTSALRGRQYRMQYSGQQQQSYQKEWDGVEADQDYSLRYGGAADDSDLAQSWFEANVARRTSQASVKGYSHNAEQPIAGVLPRKGSANSLLDEEVDEDDDEEEEEEEEEEESEDQD